MISVSPTNPNPYRTVSMEHPYRTVSMEHPYRTVSMEHPYRTVSMEHPYLEQRALMRVGTTELREF